MSRSLWMGDLEPYMDETFVNKAFLQVSQPVSVKVIRRKDNGLPAGYCFIEFPSEAEAERVLKLVNGTTINGSNPPKRFRLNRSQAGKMWDIGPSFSIFVGDLDATVTDDKLEDFFLKRYRSVKGAKIMYEEGGISRGYGFVRFSDEAEQKRALQEMQGIRGLGAKPIRVSVATPKGKMAPSTNSSTTDTTTASIPTAYDDATAYAQQLLQMQQYTDQYKYYQQYCDYYNYQQQYSYYQQQAQNSQAYARANVEQYASTEHYQASRLHQQENNNNKLEDPNPAFNKEFENAAYIAQKTLLIDCLGSHWQPIDSYTSKIPSYSIRS
uniref:tRNA selenocysteine 1-associated protein 1-like isoform X1 n=2 Tax=Ciona intestinalis TaxID=7719 RepID=UPI0000522659|nr:tRNA selenocysteine 1-associated protein 1-like isoform X1 [Ciona intestinalis]|eukprot:XP_002125303.1 tRNA selenocysteine 1-associated protein 1-like isoform X1 [Ciona intestinalis]